MTATKSTSDDIIDDIFIDLLLLLTFIEHAARYVDAIWVTTHVRPNGKPGKNDSAHVILKKYIATYVPDKDCKNFYCKGLIVQG
jgi:hypothetical protein